jgi:hypothetical protein
VKGLSFDKMDNLEKKIGFIENINKTIKYVCRLISLEIPAYIFQGKPILKKTEIDYISTKNKVVYSQKFGATPNR